MLLKKINPNLKRKRKKEINVHNSEIIAVNNNI